MIRNEAVIKYTDINKSAIEELSRKGMCKVGKCTIQKDKDGYYIVQGKTTVIPDLFTPEIAILVALSITNSKMSLIRRYTEADKEHMKLANDLIHIKHCIKGMEDYERFCALEMKLHEATDKMAGCRSRIRKLCS